MKSGLARREFLKRLSLGLGTIGAGPMLLNRFAESFVERAIAETVATGFNPSGYYIHMSFPGGPPRWLFDLPLTPQGLTSNNFKAGLFGTALENTGKITNAVYKAKAIKLGAKTVHLPPVWQMDLASQNFAKILPNTLMIRGMHNRIDSHEISARQQIAPIIGGNTIPGAVADGANRAIPAILDMGMSASGIFKSSKGLAATQIDYSVSGGRNPAMNLLMPFKTWFAGRAVNSSGVRPLQDQALAQFDLYAQTHGISETRLSAMYQNAVQLVDENIYGIADQWAPTYQRYLNLVEEALRPQKNTLPGIFDQQVYTQKSAAYALDSDEGQFITHPDARDMMTNKTVAPNMAENFALAELMLDKLTASMCLGFRGLQDISTNPAGTVGNITHDQHHIGAVISTMTTTLFYRAFLGCLTEYVGFLKNKNLFDKTILHVASEFSRVPNRIGGTGHGALCSNATLISGKFQEFNVIGNIETDHKYGTFGAAAPFAVSEANNAFKREIQVNDVARTITFMLGASDVTTNGLILTKPAGAGVWVPTYNEAKNV